MGFEGMVWRDIDALVWLSPLPPPPSPWLTGAHGREAESAHSREARPSLRGAREDSRTNGKATPLAAYLCRQDGLHILQPLSNLRELSRWSNPRQGSHNFSCQQCQEKHSFWISAMVVDGKFHLNISLQCVAHSMLLLLFTITTYLSAWELISRQGSVGNPFFIFARMFQLVLGKWQIFSTNQPGSLQR